MSTLRLGTCSWKYPSWEGLVYTDSGLRGAERNYLAEYSEAYSTVEIDQWFWSLFDTDKIRLPQVTTVAEYLSSVPENFQFTIKAPNSVTLTHFYRKGSQRGTGENPYFLSPTLFADFLDRIRPMKDQTAVILLQFEYLNQQKMRGLEKFLERLSAFLDAVGADWPLGVEIRNPNFLKTPYFEMLADRGVSPVFCQGYFLPPVASVYEQHKAGLSGGMDVVVNVNNHYEGSAPLTIEKLERLVDERRERFSQIR